MSEAEQDSRIERLVMESPPGPNVILNGRPCLYFAGTGYLGLQAHPEVMTAAAEAARTLGVHTATTRSGYGNSPPVIEVEHRVANLMGTGDGCYLVTGYAGNFALAAAIRADVDVAFIDEAAHDCLQEAVRWLDLKRPAISFRHRDAAHLDECLRRAVTPGVRPLLLTDGVFAASGRLAPLKDYLTVLGAFPGATLLVDDAHGVGVLGEAGRGAIEHAGIASSEVNTHANPASRTAVFQSLTLSKALGGHGGALAGSPEFLARVRSSSGWHRGASAPAAPVAAATAKALQIVAEQPRLRQALSENIGFARTRLRQLGVEVEEVPTSIISIQLSNAAEMARVQRELLGRGVAIAYTRDYAGAGPDGMLRIAIFATHTREMIEQLATHLSRVL